MWYTFGLKKRLHSDCCLGLKERVLQTEEATGQGTPLQIATVPAWDCKALGSDCKRNAALDTPESLQRRS